MSCATARSSLRIGAASRSAAFGNVHFIGTETSTEWNGYMEGAILSGDRGAQEVIEALGSRLLLSNLVYHLYVAYLPELSNYEYSSVLKS